MTHRVVFTPEARDDLCALYAFIADRAGEARALAYITRIRDYCDGFATLPMRGTARDDLLPGLHIIGFERSVTIAFHVDSDTVTFDRILYGGRDLEAALGNS